MSDICKDVSSSRKDSNRMNESYCVIKYIIIRTCRSGRRGNENEKQGLILPVTGNPPNPHFSFSCLASLTVVFGERTTGSRMKPFSNRLTLRTISAWSSAEQLWWITPNPPRRAIWIAMECSVTVSMGEDKRGVFRVIRFVTGVSRATSEAGKPGDGINMLIHEPQGRYGNTDVAW